LGFGNRIYLLIPNRNVALIKHAHSGTNLYSDWNPCSDATDAAHWGPHFAKFIRTVDAGLKALRAQGYDPKVRGMIWQQGESDIGNGYARQYAANLTHFTGRVRQQFSAPEMRFVYGYIYPPGCEGNDRLVIRKAEHDVDRNSGSPLSMPNAFVVVTDDLIERGEDPDTPIPNDHVHFGTNGMLDLGTRMAERMVSADTKLPTAPEVSPVTVIPDGSNYRIVNLERHQRLAQPVVSLNVSAAKVGESSQETCVFR